MAKRKRHLLAVLSFGRSATMRMITQERDEFGQRLQAHLDPHCSIVLIGRKIRVEIVGEFSEDELDEKAYGVMRVWEGEAA